MKIYSKKEAEDKIRKEGVLVFQTGHNRKLSIECRGLYPWSDGTIRDEIEPLRWTTDPHDAF